MASFLRACPGVSVWVRHWRWGWRCRPGSRVDTAGLDLISLPQPPKYRDYKSEPRLAPVTFLEGDSEVFYGYCSGWAISLSPLFCCLRACVCARTQTVTCMGSTDSLLPSRGFRMERRLSRSIDTPPPGVFSLTLLLPL